MLTPGALSFTIYISSDLQLCLATGSPQLQVTEN